MIAQNFSMPPLPRRWLTLGALLIAAATAAHGAAPKQPNIIVLLADQLRDSATAFAGDPNVRTPNLDRFARESANFRNAVAVCPVCTPYRASFLTGRFPTTTGMFLNDAYLPAEELCLAEVLKAANYDTGYIGKWHLDGHGRQEYVAPERRQGFDYWKAAECDHDYNHSHYYAGASSEKQHWPGYDAFAQTRDARQYLADHARSGKPFFLMVAYGIPHFPLGTAPAEFRALYQPENISFAPNVPPRMITPQLRRDAQGYYAHVTALDRCIGEILQSIADLGLRENTIVVFTSDHGEMMGSHSITMNTKHAPWNESAKVPFLLRHPSASGRSVNTPLTTPDIMPTLLGLAGVGVPATVEGADLSAVIRDPHTELDRPALFMGVAPFAGRQFRTPYRAIRTNRHTYVRNLEGPWLAFDEQADPFQQHNLLEGGGNQALTAGLDQRLQAELGRIHDEFRPASYYVEKFGYNLAPHGSLDYSPGAKVQSPRRPEAPTPPLQVP